MNDQRQQLVNSLLLHEPAPSKRGISRRSMLIWLAGIASAEVLASGITWSTAIQRLQGMFSKATGQVEGHAFFVSSGQLSLASNVGIADQLEINLQNVPPPPIGKSYYVWLVSDSKTQALPLSFGQLSVQNGKATLFYAGDSKHTNILNSYNSILITEENIHVNPAFFTLDKNFWRFSAAISKTPNPTDTTNHFSLLDHIRHLLSQDPKLKAAGLIGGLDIWLFRNTQKILECSGSARESSDPAFIQQQSVRILDYLDGSQFVGTEHLPIGMASMQVDPIIARVALLEIDQSQNPPGYLKHIANHLHEITQSPGVSTDQQAIANRLITAIDNVEGWLKVVHADAEKLLQMSTNQLGQPAGLALLDDMFTQANNAFIGQIDPTTLQVKEGVAQIHYNIERLATFDIRPYNGKL